MSGGKDGQNLFGRILLAIADGLTSTTAVDWHIKVKDKKWYWSNQKLLHHNQHEKNQLNP